MSPITDKGSDEKKFIALNMNPNPLIKNTFASPDRSRMNEMDQNYNDPSSSIRYSFSAIKPKNTLKNMKSKLEPAPQRGLSCNSTSKAKASDLIGLSMNNTSA